MNAITFNALAEPNRLNIIELLRVGSLSVNEIAAKADLRQPQATKHLQILTRAGLIKATPIAQRRLYELQAAPFIEMSEWIQTYRQIWEGRMDAMEEYATSIARKSNVKS